MPANLVTGRHRTRGHHCMHCHRPISNICYQKRHVAVCSAKLGSGRTCGETFAVERGCRNHPYAEGHNPGVKDGSVADNKHIKQFFYRLELAPNEAGAVGKQPDIDILILSKSQASSKKLKA